jgi:hypothetical protein
MYITVSARNGIWCAKCIIFLLCSLLTSQIIKNSLMKFIYKHKTCFQKYETQSNCADLSVRSDKFMITVKKFQCTVSAATMLSRSLATTACHVLRMWMEKSTSDMKGSCEYSEKAATNSWQGMVLQVGGLNKGLITLYHKIKYTTNCYKKSWNRDNWCVCVCVCVEQGTEPSGCIKSEKVLDQLR